MKRHVACGVVLPAWPIKVYSLPHHDWSGRVPELSAIVSMYVAAEIRLVACRWRILP